MATPGSLHFEPGVFFRAPRVRRPSAAKPSPGSRDNRFMDVLPFTPEHAGACLAIFDANCPAAFHPDERKDFVAFLAAPPYPYFVLVHDGAVLAAGGYRLIEGAASARLHWGMVRPDMQRQGLGRYLLLYRLREIGKLPGIETVECGTTPLSAPFFEKQGFRAIRVEKDGWGAGMDRVEMRKKLAVCP